MTSVSCLFFILLFDYNWHVSKWISRFLYDTIFYDFIRGYGFLYPL